MKPGSIKIIVIIAIAACLTLSCQSSRDRYVSFRGYAQGGEYGVTLNLKGTDSRLRRHPELIKAAVDSILNVIDTTLSGYNKGSQLSRFNHGDTIVPNSLFIDMYEDGYRLWKETEGNLDVAAGKLFDAWGFGFSKVEMPSDGQIREIMSHCGMKRLKEDMRDAATEGPELKVCARNLLIDSESSALPELNYNAIAQGWSCDLVAEYLYSIGVKDMLVDIGEIFCDGVNPHGKAWTIGVDKPYDGNESPGKDIQDVLHVPAGPHGVVTSGNYRKFYVNDGKKHAHTIDPKTGHPVEHNLLSATIIAPTGLEADAYATVCMVIGLDKAKELVLSRPDLDAILIYSSSSGMLVWNSLQLP